MRMTFEEVAAKMAALDAWDVAMPCHWAIKPRGCAFPYFCCTLKGSSGDIRVRFLLLEGWQTFHDFIRTRIDCEFGFYTLPMEFPHFELVLLKNSTVTLLRDDPGYVPRVANAEESARCARMLWEAYGVLLRLETDPQLPMKFADEKAMFARVENRDGVWRDEPLVIPDPRPHVEKVSFAQKMIAAAKDCPWRTDEILELDLQIVPQMMTREPRPRVLYVLAAVDASTGAVVFCDKTSVTPEGGLRGLWESMPPRVLAHFVGRRCVPGELRVQSGRVYRLLRPLCAQIPFKLSKVPALTHFDKALQNL